MHFYFTKIGSSKNKLYGGQVDHIWLRNLEQFRQFRHRDLRKLVIVVPGHIEEKRQWWRPQGCLSRNRKGKFYSLLHFF
jgi:hypothetical protein